MLYRFRSKASGDVVMLSEHGDRLLELLGREPAARGIVEVAAMPAAIAALERAAAESPPDAAAADRADDVKDAARAVGLGARLWPMIEMLKRCHAAGEPIVWGV